MSAAALLLLAFLLAAVVMSRLASALGLKLPWYRDIVLLAITPWLAGVLLYLLPVFEFRERLEMRHALYLVGMFACLVLGAMTARFIAAGRLASRGNKGVEAVSSMGPESRGLLWGLGLLGFVSQAAMVGRGLAASSISLQDRLLGEGLDIVRLQSTAQALGIDGSGHTRLAIFGAAAFVFVCMVAGGCLARAQLKPGARSMLRWLAIGCAFLIAFNGVFIRGGRMELVLLMAAVSLAALLDTERHTIGALRRRFANTRGLLGLSAAVLVAALGWYLATGFTKSRIGTASAYAAMEAYHRTKPAAWVEDLTYGHENLEFAVLNLSYLPVPLTTFAYFYDMHEAQFPGPYFGQYNFTGPVTFVMRRAGYREDQKTLQDIRFEATRDLRLHGFGDNVWSTVYRDLALDVGWSGVPLVMLLLGGLGQAVLLAAGRSRGDVYLALAPLTVLFMLFSLAHALFVLESFAVGLYMCFAVMVFQVFTRKPKAPAALRWQQLQPSPARLPLAR